MTDEEPFDPRAHTTKHMTLGRWGRLQEATRVHSWPEQDWLAFKLFLAYTLDPTANATPQTIKTIMESRKYWKAYNSYRFGPLKVMSMKGLLIILGVTAAAVILLLYLGGYL
jgi:hypothetical protein